MTPDALRAARSRLGLTNPGLAEALGVPVRTLEGWMSKGAPARYARIVELAIEALDARD